MLFVMIVHVFNVVLKRFVQTCLGQTLQTV